MSQTTQQIFDKAAAHLLKQNKRAIITRRPVCAYRGDNGAMCAVGCLVADEQYSPEMEGVGVSTLLEHLRKNDVEIADMGKSAYALYQSLKASGIDADDESTLELLNALQKTHDGAAPACWRGALKSVATQFKLSAEVLA